MSRNQLIDEVNKWLRRFDISEEEILTAAELDRLHLEAYRRTLPETDHGRFLISDLKESDEEKETLANLMCFLNLLTEAKRHNLMCLLYLGRDIGYYGLTKSVVSSFVSYAEEWGKVPRKSLSGCHRPEYLAGKPISKWLGQVKQELNAGTLPDDIWKVTLFNGENEKEEEFSSLDDAWKRYHELIAPASADLYTSIHLTGYSWTGRAITRIARTEFGI